MSKGFKYITRIIRTQSIIRKLLKEIDISMELVSGYDNSLELIEVTKKLNNYNDELLNEFNNYINKRKL